MFKYILVLFTFFSFSFISCDHCGDNADKACFEFDQRQCSGDIWAELVPVGDEEEEREEKMKNYLESLGFEVFDVNLVIRFHHSVCEACNVCPEEDRFFVKIAEEQSDDFLDLDYLNLAKTSCSDAF